MISNQQMIFRKHLKIYFLEPFKIWVGIFTVKKQ